MLNFVSNVLKAIDGHKNFFGLFLDLIKVFDMFNHSLLLLKKLEQLGIRGLALVWISTFIIRREQIVKLNYTDDNGCIGPRTEPLTSFH